jgi:hypothetical protein
MRVIGFLGRKRAGKDTSAKFLREALEEDGYTVAQMAIADPLKQACAAIFTGGCMEPFYDDDKKESLAIYGDLVPRDVMERASRALKAEFGAHLFVQAFRCALARAPEVDFMLVTDIRFPEEASLLLDNFDARIFHIERPTQGPPVLESDKAVVRTLHAHGERMRTIVNKRDLALLRMTVMYDIYTPLIKEERTDDT